MIPVSRLVAATAVLVALGAHGSALIMRSGPEEVQFEGGSSADITAYGNAFANLVAGTNRPVKAEVNEADTPPDTTQKPDSVEVTPKEQPVQKALQVTKTETAQTAAPAETSAAAKPPVQMAPTTPTPLSSQAPLVQQTTATIQLPTARAESTKAPSPSVQPTPSVDQPETAAQTKTVLTYNEPVAVAAARPAARPVAKPEKPTKPIMPVIKQQPKPKSTPRAQGNSDQNAKRGTATGTQPKAKAKSGKNNAHSSTQGNAAATNYKGLVHRKINRKKLRVKVKGTVLVSFAISASGALTRLTVSRSSGSAKLDQLALQQVRRAAPFSAPPGGALSYSIEIRSK